ncbi:hypothetical protein [Rubrimonas cliftonensis]|uniref:Uncharacterized protein n=1 Tax=Rubrimonas cliftonensis TaxID=89524 RepID=A0A1H4ERG1_9RHOB|nr:hypothetical protein [Rubrimonas cliftonensis]SEA87506.1 hypothetical protein SAMN05444370_11554 [Rubrimonas cliftonensis]
MSVVSFETVWTTRAAELLRGRRIVDVVYADRDQTRRVLHWSLRPPVLMLDNGVALYPSADPEGNDAGALMTSSDRLPVLPPLRLEEFIPRRGSVS